jgi:hypothetical protein
MTALLPREPDCAEHGSILAGADGDHIRLRSQPQDQTTGGALHRLAQPPKPPSPSPLPSVIARSPNLDRAARHEVTATTHVGDITKFDDRSRDPPRHRPRTRHRRMGLNRHPLDGAPLCLLLRSDRQIETTGRCGDHPLSRASGHADHAKSSTACPSTSSLLGLLAPKRRQRDDGGRDHPGPRGRDAGNPPRLVASSIAATEAFQ